MTTFFTVIIITMYRENRKKNYMKPQQQEKVKTFYVIYVSLLSNFNLYIKLAESIFKCQSDNLFTRTSFLLLCLFAMEILFRIEIFFLDYIVFGYLLLLLLLKIIVSL